MDEGCLMVASPCRQIGAVSRTCAAGMLYARVMEIQYQRSGVLDCAPHAPNDVVLSALQLMQMEVHHAFVRN